MSAQQENKDVAPEAKEDKKEVPSGRFGFRRSDTSAAILQIESDGKYIDVNIKNIGFEGSVALINHLYTQFGIYVMINQYTSLAEALEQINGIFINYTYDRIAEKMTPQVKA